MPKREQRCETCRAWQAAGGSGIGECHRHAPKPILRDPDFSSPYWPETGPNEWCCEWLAPFVTQAFDETTAGRVPLPVSPVDCATQDGGD